MTTPPAPLNRLERSMVTIAAGRLRRGDVHGALRLLEVTATVTTARRPA